MQGFHAEILKLTAPAPAPLCFQLLNTSRLMYFAFGGVSDLLIAFCRAVRLPYHSFKASTPVGFPPVVPLLEALLFNLASGFPLSFSDPGESAFPGLWPSSSDSPGERGRSGSPQVPWGLAMYLQQ